MLLLVLDLKPAVASLQITWLPALSSWSHTATSSMTVLIRNTLPYTTSLAQTTSGLPTTIITLTILATTVATLIVARPDYGVIGVCLNV